ncbi:RNase H-like domain found in reverse transcriptase [Popillia japonica]|uniref:RNase H-like domain found in reverse transcriptase n=1 Tax=Popillia japonica TaxID=7064 RepID=A0AAW1L4Y5_POPJA
MLLQRQRDGIMHPVFFYSKRTTDAESRYSSYELECLSIINSLKRFYIYLHGIPFKILTDCDSLRMTLNKKDVVPRIMRWVLYLENFNYKLEHRPNNKMVHVDALSRAHLMIIEDNTLEQVLGIKQATWDKAGN